VEWTANGIKPEIDNPDLQQVPFEEVPEMVEPLEKGKEFCGWIKELPPGKTRTLLESQNIRSILVLPVMASKRFIGFLGFDDCTNYRKWTVEEKSVLQALCSSLGRSLQGAAVQHELQQAQVKLEELNASLEEKVKERTAELDNALAELRVAQNEIVQQEKLAILGKLAAGVAHEMNTPLGAITSSADNLSNILRAMFKDGLKDADPTIIKEACKLADDFTAHDTLTSRQERVERKSLAEYIRTEYDLGPIAEQHALELVECGVLKTDKEILDHIYSSGNVEMALNITTTVMRVRKSVSTIEVAAQKAANVVRALKSYVRNDNLHNTNVFDVRRSINDVLLLFNNQMKKGVELHLDMEEQLLMQGNESELSKVWSNLIANALYAMEYSGNLWIAGRTERTSIILTFSNDGPAITEEVMTRLFEPFYTTKPIGEGSGMGLSIVFNIVASMSGSIEVESQERTTFTVTLPKASI
jgi:signal transduction histidine kinase